MKNVKIAFRGAWIPKRILIVRICIWIGPVDRINKMISIFTIWFLKKYNLAPALFHVEVCSHILIQVLASQAKNCFPRQIEIYSKKGAK